MSLVGEEESPHDETETQTQENEADENAELIKEATAKQESKAVGGLRIMVFTVLVCSMVGVAVAVYLLATNVERSKFEEQFQDDASKVLQSIGTSFELTLGAVDMLVVSLLSHARATNQNWPLVTVPDFAARAEKILRLTNIYFLDLHVHVTADNRSAWEAHTERDGLTWLRETNGFMMRSGSWNESLAANYTEDIIANFIHVNGLHENGTYSGPEEIDRQDPGPFLPRWHSHTPFHEYPYNWDYLRGVSNNESMLATMEAHKAVLGDTVVEEDMSWILAYPDPNGDVTSQLIYPIIDDSVDYLRLHGLSDNNTGIGDEDGTYDPAEHRFLGALAGTIIWSDWMAAILPRGSNGIRVYFEDECGTNFTYQINGPNAEFLGAGDHHESAYDHLEIALPFLSLHQYTTRARESFEYTGVPVDSEHCPFMIKVYPSSVMESRFITSIPAILCAASVLIFVFSALLFVTYDWCVERRQRKVSRMAIENGAVVRSLYPAAVREQLFKTQAVSSAVAANSSSGPAIGAKMGFPNKQSAFLASSHGSSSSAREEESLPIAQLYPEATVLFGDIAGFTSWSSKREPTQVFVLLETLYGMFDKLAKRRRVFKIETIGDCYVAVAGIPNETKRHTVIMARFAADMLHAMSLVSRELELELGPGTQDLRLRIGLHSGAVTAGVLRGEKARFQLFGDTVNTAARMESNGLPGRIHCSQKTADSLIEHGKQDWVTKRSELIEAKGKGSMQTYWIETKVVGTTASTYFDGSIRSSSTLDLLDDTYLLETSKHRKSNDSHEPGAANQTERLVDWHTTILLDALQVLEIDRMARGDTRGGSTGIDWEPSTTASGDPIAVRDEVVQSIAGLSRHEDATREDHSSSAGKVEIPDEVARQLRTLVGLIGHSHSPENPFHDFEQTSHSIMFITKSFSQMKGKLDVNPLSHVAILFAALACNVGHPGVPNSQLVLENAMLARRYGSKCVTQQNACDIVWTMFMRPSFADLRTFLFCKTSDLALFRQVFVNAVISTDVDDDELQAMRDHRWIEHISAKPPPESDAQTLSDSRATAILECLFQAFSHSHRLQHWIEYQHWNALLFTEMLAAYRNGRLDQDPSHGWYEAELASFDQFVIPLAAKLKECGAIGPSSHVLFDQACDNRLEWECKGRDVVEEIMNNEFCDNIANHQIVEL